MDPSRQKTTIHAIAVHPSNRTNDDALRDGNGTAGIGGEGYTPAFYAMAIARWM
jgi:hypothetical protein